ncbi:MAG: glutathione S-transferase N-terminal domain-containing protein [Gammaproteobacteria bacterium]|jgi:RNA polymerase-associated protein|nr:glutathione S-transferase N-terminal domain-containing protein [Xanthomonadaceae bacterium]
MATTPRSRNTLTLYSAKNCVVCHKVRMVMAAKGITYDLIAVDTANPPEDLLMLAPHYHSVPTLVERDNAIYISNVISEYLDERYPHPALMPAEPIFRAMHRIAVRQVEQDWVPQVQAIMAGGKNVEPARKRLKELILESLPFFKSNKFFFGNEMSLVDCAITPIIWRLPALGIQLPKDAKCVEDYGLRIFRNPAFMRSMTPEEKVLRDLAFS